MRTRVRSGFVKGQETSPRIKVAAKGYQTRRFRVTRDDSSVIISLKPEPSRPNLDALAEAAEENARKAQAELERKRQQEEAAKKTPPNEQLGEVPSDLPKSEKKPKKPRPGMGILN